MHIFLSRPTWVSPEFEEGLKIFLMSLANLGLSPRTLGSTDYPSKAPLDEVLEIMDQCQGAIILGYPQLIMESGKIKDFDIDSPLSLPTEWNHIEGALAYSKSLPIMILHHKGVSRGVFDRGVMNAFVHEVDFTQASWCMDKALNGAIQKWKENCESGNPNFSAAVKVDPDKPVCPNCTSPSKPVYLSKLPAGFSLGKLHCSKCSYLEQ
ncbi:hypothetical protein [Microbulbifer sp. ANSA005]|uniref:hypothetical protein n=1 Tax=Microbulbifer sp. ANSA005 TaxID=3243362 RepID=UPI0040411C77